MARNYQGNILSPSIRAAQQRYYGQTRFAPETAERDPLTPDEQAFIAARDSFYLATVTETGWPYLQHRGGRPGFLHMLDEHTLAFADYRGNRQLISTGNLAVNDRASLFLMDYPRRERLKILGHVRIEDARQRPDLVPQLATPEEIPLVERLFFVDVVSFDWNCSQHITPRFTVAELEAAFGPNVPEKFRAAGIDG